MKMMSDFEQAVRQLRVSLDKRKSERSLVKQNMREEKGRLKHMNALLVRVQSSQQAAQEVSQIIQQQAHNKLTKVVTTCLQTVFFDEDYGFKIRFERKRNKTEAILLITNGGHEVEDPTENEGLGVLDVAAFVLQLACLMLKKPDVRKFMVLDEPFKFVSVEYRTHVREMLEMLQREFDVQIVMVTHMEELICGKVVRI